MSAATPRCTSGAATRPDRGHRGDRRAGLLQVFDFTRQLHVADQLFPVRLGGAHALQAVAIWVDVGGSIRSTQSVDDRHLDGATVVAPCALGVHRPDGPVRKLVLVGVVPRVTSAATHGHGVGTSLELSEVFAELGLHESEATTEAALNLDELLVLGLVDHTFDLEVDDAVTKCCQLDSTLLSCSR